MCSACGRGEPLLDILLVQKRLLSKQVTWSPPRRDKYQIPETSQSGVGLCSEEQRVQEQPGLEQQRACFIESLRVSVTFRRQRQGKADTG